ncbi:hypothetical protein GGR56DRAFT_186381 [Xylariaceae sp. FL0804]|nr:hypothetical protein GGR56DRAFT_186381 [Xylariaceae sp. FL0804]
MTFLETIFAELGISQYLGTFIDQGFDSWETILDITESDLDTLGVKLGHRRRRIANYRGLAPEASLVSPARTSIEDGKPDLTRAEHGRADSKDGTTVTKRKYRRHPKPDENAPERPPSAYVLFSNKMREDLKGQNLTFTEIAKLVGENWQSLDRAEKEPFERQAHDAKERYNSDLSHYKKTREYKKYNEYLHDFRKRQAAQMQDTSKRLKTEADGARGCNGASLSLNGSTSNNVSSSESQNGSEPPPSRRQRMGSAVSASDSHYSTYTEEPVHSPRALSNDDVSFGHSRGLPSPISRDPSRRPSTRRDGWQDGSRLAPDSSNIGVPWLDPRAAPGNLVHSPDNSVPSASPSTCKQGTRGRGSFMSQPPSLTTEQSSTGSISSISSRGLPQPPPLTTEQSSTGSISSLSSHNSYLPRTPSDASLPIHALLSSKPDPPLSLGTSTPPTTLPSIQQQTTRPGGDTLSNGRARTGNGSVSGHSTPGYQGTAFPVNQNAAYNKTLEPFAQPAASKSANLNNLDGISALLRAREIVDRRP